MNGPPESGTGGMPLSAEWPVSESGAVGPAAFVFPGYSGLVRDELSNIRDGSWDCGRAISCGCGGSLRDRRNLSGIASGDSGFCVGAGNPFSNKPFAGTDRGKG